MIILIHLPMHLEWPVLHQRLWCFPSDCDHILKDRKDRKPQLVVVSKVIRMISMIKRFEALELTLWQSSWIGKVHSIVRVSVVRFRIVVIVRRWRCGVVRISIRIAIRVAIWITIWIAGVRAIRVRIASVIRISSVVRVASVIWRIATTAGIALRRAANFWIIAVETAKRSS